MSLWFVRIKRRPMSFERGTVANRRGSSEKGVEIFEDFCEHEGVSNRRDF